MDRGVWAMMLSVLWGTALVGMITVPILMNPTGDGIQRAMDRLLAGTGLFLVAFVLAFVAARVARGVPGRVPAIARRLPLAMGGIVVAAILYRLIVSIIYA